MVVKMSSPGRSFGGVADYCLHDPRMPGEAHHPESAERVEWTATRNLATSEGERAGRIMAATAEASPELKRLAGVAATGRKLEKPVCHYSLSWAKDEKPNRQEMRWAAQESLKALGMERHQALVVSHRDGQPHVHVIANRVDPESGKAAGLNRSKLKLSKWAEEYERVQGKIRCPQRERNNARRGQGKRVQDRVSRPTGRHRRAEMNPQQQERQAKIPAGRDGWGGPERERVAWQRAEERWEWEQLQPGFPFWILAASILRSFSLEGKPFLTAGTHRAGPKCLHWTLSFSEGDNSSVGRQFFRHSSELHSAASRFRTRERPFYPLGSGSAQILCSMSPNSLRFRCPSANNNQ